MITNIKQDIQELVQGVSQSGHGMAAILIGAVIVVCMALLFILGLPFMGLNQLSKI